MRIEIECERTLFAKLREQVLTTTGQFLCGSGTEHLLHSFWTLDCDRRYIGLRHCHKQEEMAVQERQCSVNNLWPHGRLGQIGDPQDQRAPWLKAVESRAGAHVVSLIGFSPRLRQAFNQNAEVRGTTAWKYALLESSAVDQQSNAVTGIERQLRKDHRC